MNPSPISRRAFLLGAAGAALVPKSAFAQELLRQLTVVVGFPPGGATDILARLIADGMRGTYAQAVVVDNRAGAAGRVGVELVKNARNDGSTVLFTPAFPMLISPHVYPKLAYDTLRDFVPVGIGAKRSRFLPEVPTMAELGYPEVLFQDWLGLFAPAGTPPDIVARMNAAAAAAVKSESGLAGLGKLGMELDLAAPGAFAQMVRADWERYRTVVQASGFKPED